MSLFYVGFVLGEEIGRVLLGNLRNGEMQVSEVRRFPTNPIRGRDSVHWNIPQIYHELMEGLKTIASYEEPIQSVSCTSVAGDYLVFDGEGALITPTVHHSDPEAMATGKKLAPSVPWDMIYEETGTLNLEPNRFLQLGAEPAKRLKRASMVLSLADGFNFLLGGEARMELSMASATGLYNPVTRQWASQVLEALKVPSGLLPPVVMGATVLGRLREDICQETGLESARVSASCSQQTAALLAGLPILEDETWAFLSPGKRTLSGTQVAQPFINEFGRQLHYTNHLAYDGSVCLHKRSVGLEILSQCHQFWEERDRSIDKDLLSHLAGSATPFESLIDPEDPRFATAGDMPLKIQAFCRETNQTIPRKPGPIYRCILESLALHYRKLVGELERFTESPTQRLYVANSQPNMLLNHFTANALQLPVEVVSGDAAGAGNLILQAIATGHVHSADQARGILRRSCKVELIVPHAHIWEQAYDRFLNLATGVTVEA
jgi:rhamnulokinase